MSPTYEMMCEICLRAFPIETFGDGDCPHCGQGYDYVEGEGHHLSLTLEQIAALQALAKLPDVVVYRTRVYRLDQVASPLASDRVVVDVSVAGQK